VSARASSRLRDGPGLENPLRPALWSTESGKGQFMKLTFASVVASFLLISTADIARTQEARLPDEPARLADLLAEAERNNPQIQAARHETEGAKQVPKQVSTLPDPQVVLQHVSVGSPRPFAGYTNSDFAYIGLGFSQDIPYPGKLRLRGEIAN